MAHFSSAAMSSLQPGVILKLLQAADPSSRKDTIPLTGHLVPAILQVTGITPAVAGPDIFAGHQGFYLRLSDLSHSSYFSLPAEHDDLILADRLHLGQLLQVNCLKPSVPVPILHEFLVLPGRFPCLKDTADLTVPNPNSNSTSTDIKKVIYTSSCVLSDRAHPSPKVKSHLPRSVSATASRTWFMSSPPENSTLKKGELERRSSEVLSELRKIRVTCPDDDSGHDSDESSRSRFSSCTSSSSNYSSLPNTATLKSVRKVWDDTESLKRIKPTHSRSRSASLSPNRLPPLRSIPKNPSSLEKMSSKRKTERAFNVLGSFSKRKIYPTPRSPPKTTRDSSCTPSHFCAANCVKWPENSVAWTSLSQNLSKHGKEALKHRDSSLQTALDALMEASASNILIQCLSKYAEIHSDKDDDPKDLIDRYLKFQRDLDQAILITQSMTKQKQLNKAISKIANERKQCAFSWIKAALESNLTKHPNQAIPHSKFTTPVDETLGESKIVSPVSCCQKTRSRKSGDNMAEQITFLAVLELAAALRIESTRWFLKYVEKFLDAVEACESHVGGVLCQMKKLDDWLNDVVKKEKAVVLVDKNKDCAMLSEDEDEACERVRKKIYGVLLRHVESAALALESISVTDEEKET
ncbi:hypothetical protein LUZ63_005982 [Rhynchospora breviuscula]|uniref:Uncharacterized protein n=1 Tax=Rhynchospora breviuscula TaxID=2022672 RepID=A0A9Q0HTL1_9POAL|nr:hypothetical protein LUZ63_005982 [Rhynchospora breviuscula]